MASAAPSNKARHPGPTAGVFLRLLPEDRINLAGFEQALSALLQVVLTPAQRGDEMS